MRKISLDKTKLISRADILHDFRLTPPIICESVTYFSYI